MIRSLALFVLLLGIGSSVRAQAPAPPATDATAKQAQREAALATLLRGATLEGSFTVTGPGFNPAKLAREKYTLGAVKKLDGNLWLFPTRIQYADKDLQLPISLPIEWAGDTPVVVVDNVGLPGLGTVSARVMFFADHYAGYWKHGEAGGHLFGVIHRAEAEAKTAVGASAGPAGPSSGASRPAATSDMSTPASSNR